MLVKIENSNLAGKAVFPPSKSMSHRLIIAASLASGESVVRNVSRCDDTLATMASLTALGAKFIKGDDNIRVGGIDINEASADSELFVNESGSTLRFLIPLAYLTDKEITFRGAKRLFERPLSVYQNIADDLGLVFRPAEDSLTVKGRLTPGEYKIPGNISSQFITGLLFALPMLDGDSKIVIQPPFESRPYVDMTIKALETFGVSVEYEDEYTILIKGRQRYTAADTAVEGDWSGGAFLFALSMLHPEISISGYDKESLQGDKICLEYFEKIRAGNPALDISDCPDLGPILFAMAAYFSGATFTGTKRLKIKESDRAEAMRCELEKFGARVEISEDSVTVKGGDLHEPVELLSGHGDHRIVMSLATLASKLGGKILGAEAIKKSYPEFFEVFSLLGGEMEISEE
jgi:3-phosphoshikimate 1-carboxyvinyltransferase